MFFEKSATVRLTLEAYEQIEAIVKLNKAKYENVSHFIRCGALKLLQEELKK